MNLRHIRKEQDKEIEREEVREKKCVGKGKKQSKLINKLAQRWMDEWVFRASLNRYKYVNAFKEQTESRWDERDRYVFKWCGIKHQ